MNGIENITGRIAADAQAEAEALLAGARTQAEGIARQWADQAQKEAADILSRGQAIADERRERLISVARMEGKKLLLSARQEMIGQAFDRALEKLRSLPQEEYADLLSGLCAKAAVTGREEIIFSEKDKAGVGAKVVDKANELLGATGKLTVSKETRPIRGGVILSDGGVEVNCGFDTLVRLARPELERQVAQVLFED